jgi:hypothetical protein
MVLSPGRPVGQSLPWAFDLDREFHYRGDTADAILAGGFLKDRHVQGGDKTSHGNAGGLLSVAA